MNKLQIISENVLRCEDDISVLRRAHVEQVKRLARDSHLQRARINFHSSDNHSLHEMILAMTSHTIVEPHFHPNKTESFHLIEGVLRIGLMTDVGDLAQIVELDANENMYYRMNTPKWHIVLPMTDMVVVHETTSGPFVPGESSIFPVWPRELITKLRKSIGEERII